MAAPIAATPSSVIILFVQYSYWIPHSYHRPNANKRYNCLQDNEAIHRLTGMNNVVPSWEYMFESRRSLSLKCGQHLWGLPACSKSTATQLRSDVQLLTQSCSLLTRKWCSAPAAFVLFIRMYWGTQSTQRFMFIQHNVFLLKLRNRM